MAVKSLNIAEFNPGSYYVTRAKHNADIIRSIRKLCEEKRVKQGVFFVIGALKEARIGYYNQNTLEYQEKKITTPCEIATCTGNISQKDDEVSIHAHAVLTDEEGEAKGGHLIGGKVFAAEIHVQELEGENLVRQHDEKTDLELWDLE